MTKSSQLPVSWKWDLVHFRQRYDWDCGLSCILMLLPRQKRNYFLENFTEICSEEGFGQSTWTIDLCYVLKRFGVHHKYLTSTIGVNDGYNQHSYYGKIIQQDSARVDRRFKSAPSQGIIVEQQQITRDALIRHIALEGPAIVLTNASLLTCDICKSNKFSTELRSCLPWRASFKGHYILLCGYIVTLRKFFYRNPAMKDHICMTSFVNFHNARVCYGTDDDVILIYNNQKDRPQDDT
ncbi:protein GUCD1 [Lutzomyia longipalpis]|uniref:Putative guanylylate cyclase n=1 Tax=Lutzomyia longipalpis TaxID=7200 RepID=A0A1B0CCT2_LUTLO|nr:protein GUCD1 [Lutzomyia longipalpis]